MLSQARRLAAVVTDAAQGIAAGCAQVFAQEGYATVLADKDIEGAKNPAKDLVDEGLEVRAVLCDVTDGQTLADMFDETFSVYSRLDTLINNAGTHISGNILERTDEHWDFLLRH